MTKPKPERVIATVQRLRKELGDVPLSEAEARLKNPPPKPEGQGTWWDRSSRVNIFLCVEAIRKARGIGPTAAKRAVAKFYGLTLGVVEKEYVAGRKLYVPPPEWLRDDAEIFFCENAPKALKEFLQKTNHPQK